MQRTPSAPTVAACAVCGGRTIVSPGPSSMSPPAVWNTIRPRTQYSTFFVAVLMPAVSIVGAVAPPVRAQALGTHPGCDLVFTLRRTVMPLDRSISAHSRAPLTAASVVCRRGSQAAALADRVGRERRIIEAIRHRE
jgi:hypothetical protein